MEQQQAVRRRYIGKQGARPSEFVRVCQPLAAPLLVPVSLQPRQPKRKRTQSGTRVQFAGQRLSCSASLRGALMARLQQERASRNNWTEKQWERVVQEVAKENWGAMSHGGYRQKKVRGEQQAVSDQAQVDHGSIISVVGEAKSGQDESSATGKEQREEGQVVHTASAVGEQQAVSDQAQVDHDSIISVVGEAKSAVGQDESSATGKEQREEGQVVHTASTIGEQQAVSDQAQVDHDSIISVVGEAKSAVGQDESSATGKEQREDGQVAHTVSAVGEEHASVQDSDLVTLKTQRLVEYTVHEFIANGSYGAVYKASDKSTGRLFAIKVMTKSKKTAKMTIGQQRELSLMKEISGKQACCDLDWVERDVFRCAVVYAFVRPELATVHSRTQCSVLYRHQNH